MNDALLAHWEMLIGRWYGPLSFRLIIQPCVAAILAARAGLADARAKQPPYGWSIITQAGHRLELVRHGWRDIGKLFLTALLIDVVYQIIVFKWVFPGQTLLVAATLAVPAYVIVRGLTNRLVGNALGNRLPVDGVESKGRSR